MGEKVMFYSKKIIYDKINYKHFRQNNGNSRKNRPRFLYVKYLINFQIANKVCVKYIWKKLL